ncbi:Kelch repeat-containing protein [Nonomuraea zeae]|uniref:Kelch-like protein 17 n=1 Tax=Nonomuraea zeae TaxID=1642303 RepID=A0A5S4FYV4_9ACTN|nr:kelch repeat-containing protein [Nonomuraea zeae]TMR25879.1 Kelch-like protein 17 [Nonomuraea zeae]
MTTSTLAATGAWATAADLPVAASWYGQHDGAVLLDDDGRVLVAGGADAGGAALDQSAVYDPAAQVWQAVGALRTPRKLHTVTRLDDGRVLVAGGLSGSAGTGPGLASAELYDPATRSWTATGAMTVPRWGHSAVLLPDGSVLVAGGSAVRSGGTTKALRSAERYDPATGTWTATEDMTDARTGHTAVPLAGGVVLVCGGSAPVGSADDPALAFCELFTPGTATAPGTWTPTGSLLRARRHHQVTRLSDNAVLVTGGTAPGASGDGPFDPFSQRTAERFDLAGGGWTAVADMPSGRAFHRAVPFGTGQVLVAGGTASDRDESGYRSAVLFDPPPANPDPPARARTGSDEVTETGPAAWAGAAGLGTGRWAFAAAVLPDGRVLVAGGVTRSGLAAADPAVPELTRTSEIFTGSGS